MMNNENQKKNTLLFSVSTLIFMLGILTPVFYYGNQTEDLEILEESEKSVQKEFYPNPFDEVSIEARSAIVWDIARKEMLYGKNSNQVMPLASVTKILTALTALEILPEDTVVNIEREFLMAEGNSGLFVDEKWSIKDLLDFSLISSLNDGVKAAASVAGAFSLGTEDYLLGREEFVSRMNHKAQEIGLRQSRFYNESGLDVDEELSGGYSTARETALLLEYVLHHHPEIFQSTGQDQAIFQSLTGIEHRASNTNTGVNRLPGVLASKTGFTDLSGGNLVIIFDPAIGRPIVISVLGSSREGRVADVLELAEKTLEYISYEEFLKKTEEPVDNKDSNL